MSNSHLVDPGTSSHPPMSLIVSMSFSLSLSLSRLVPGYLVGWRVGERPLREIRREAVARVYSTPVIIPAKRGASKSLPVYKEDVCYSMNFRCSLCRRCAVSSLFRSSYLLVQLSIGVNLVTARVDAGPGLLSGGLAHAWHS